MNDDRDYYDRDIGTMGVEAAIAHMSLEYGGHVHTVQLWDLNKILVYFHKITQNK